MDLRQINVPNELFNEDEGKTKESSYDRHPEWFETVGANDYQGGLHLLFCDKMKSERSGAGSHLTKEDYMNNKLEFRIKTYFKDLKKVLKKRIDLPTNQLAQKIITDFNTLLKNGLVQNRYFDRRSNGTKFCDDNGRFQCKPKPKQCKQHFINPYSNKIQRIYFIKWTLDHYKWV